MEKTDKYSLFGFGLMSVVNVVTIIVIGWSCYHGFELSDESYYYLGYSYADQTPELTATSFHMVYGNFFSAFNFTLPEVRLLRLILTIASSGVLFLGLNKVILSKNVIKKLFFLTLC